jgi:sulfite exporter TauE/SafE
VDPSLTASGLGVAGIGAAAAFTTGLLGSGHCALMCGPLACAGPPGPPAARGRLAVAWQLGRLGAYTAAGAVLGGAGRAAMAALAAPAARALPWMMAAGLIVAALELGKRVPPLPGLARIPRGLSRMSARFSPPARAALRGVATPFLPCGLLYGAFLMAAAAGSPAGGALVMASFGAGAIPALAIIQLNIARLTRHPRAYSVARRAVPLVAAAVLIWRALAVKGSCH